LKFGRNAMLEVIQFILGLVLITGMAWVAWESSVMISEKKERQRKGLTDYYDMPIKKDGDETIS
jgi:hypothetical protein